MEKRGWEDSQQSVMALIAEIEKQRRKRKWALEKARLWFQQCGRMDEDIETITKDVEQAEAALEKEIEASEFWRVRHEEAEADRDKWMGQFDEAEHRGLAYMEERDKLAARVEKLEAIIEDSLTSKKGKP